MPRRYLIKRAILFTCRRIRFPAALEALLLRVVFRLDGNRCAVSGRNNRIAHREAALARVSIEIDGADNEIVISPGAILTDCRIRVRGNGHRLTIGTQCVLRGTTFVFEDSAAEIRLGERTTIEGAHLAAVEPGSRVTIGDNCMFSHEIDLRTSDSHGLYDRASGQRLNPPGDVTIGNRVWLGVAVMVLKGTTVGDGAVIGARSLVTRDVPANCLAVGMPARVVRENVSWSRERLPFMPAEEATLPPRAH